MFKKILIANRGEVACRIFRTCQRLGLRSAGVHSAADRHALHVRTIGESYEIGAAAASASYLNIAAIIEVAKRAGAQAIHPGIGFLAENPDFARAVEVAGLIFIGPTPDVLERFGDKGIAKLEAERAGIPVIRGGGAGSASAKEIAAMVRKIGVPVVLKAAGGGGGKGMRLLTTLDGLDEAIEAAMRESKNAFGRPELIVEQYVPYARHIEVQIAGDGKGGMLHLFERECSLQRRHQKVIEEAPAAGLSAKVRAAVLDAACRLGAQVNYRGLGTVEFLVRGEEYFFLEVNPRLQVEHPATELVTGVDLVELQLHVAGASRLPLQQNQIAVRGHAIEARLYAEDAKAGFLPSTGHIDLAVFPAGVRVDTGVESGDEITPYYDPMIAKLIAHADARAGALDKLLLALRATTVFGVETNTTFLEALLDCREMREGKTDTGFIDRVFANWKSPQEGHALETAALAGALWLDALTGDAQDGPWRGRQRLTAWRLGVGAGAAAGVSTDVRRLLPILTLSHGEGEHDVTFSRNESSGVLQVHVDGKGFDVAFDGRQGHAYQVHLDGRRFTAIGSATESKIHVHGPGGRASYAVRSKLGPAGSGVAAGGDLLAPMMGTVLKVSAKKGDAVQAGDVLVVIESMKMELRVAAQIAGTVKKMNCQAGGKVERGSVLAEIEPAQ